MGLRPAVAWWHDTARRAWSDDAAFTFDEWLTEPVADLAQRREAKVRRSRMHAVKAMGGEVA